ncbi:MAG: (2Fe-2S)-binding protein [Betaproteobacteria bacterium]|nr:(2Fe-2S)-binding protein [Betaproteobacteria bacterium]
MDEITPLTISIDLNGSPVQSTVQPRMLLVEWIRGVAGQTGTHIGCDTSYCGACTVLLNDQPVKSCTVLAAQADGARVRTVEGLEIDGQPCRLQQCFSKQHALQCGYCTPGMLMAATALLEQGGMVDEASVRKALSGNVCRCTGYQNIVAAVLTAAQIN